MPRDGRRKLKKRSACVTIRRWALVTLCGPYSKEEEEEELAP